MTSRRRRLAGGAALVAATLVAVAEPAAAHGVGERGDLPLPLWQVAWGAGLAVAISFAALGALWHRPVLARTAEGRRLPAGVVRALGVAGVVARVAALVVAGLVVWSAFAGSTNPNTNLAPVTFFVVLWVGGQLLSALGGDVWPAVSPVDTLARGARLRADGIEATHWPATAGVLAFLWMELAYHDPSNPRFVGGVVVGATVALLVAAARHGRTWLREGDPLGALFGLLGGLAPVGREPDGLRLRPPVVGLTRLRPRSGTVALVLVTLGGTTFDGITRTRLWGGLTADHGDWAVTALHTIGLVWFVGVLAIVYVGAVRTSARLTGDDPHEVADRYVHSLVPIALAYAIAHYFSLLVFEGQRFLIVLSDPLARGWDLLGTADWRVDYALISPGTIAWVQAGAIVVGHVLGVVLAHDRALEHDDAATALRGQYPLLGAMIAYTVGGLLLLLNA